MAWTRYQAGFDLHGDKQNKDTVAAFLKFSKQWKPKLRFFGGDLWDFRPLRRKAEEDEKRQSMKEDFEAGANFLKAWRPTHYLRGNHCERLWDLARWGQGILADYALSGIAEITGLAAVLGIKMLPYHKREGVLQIGELKVLHGFTAGVYAARATAQVYGGCLFGHIHAFDQASIAGLNDRVAQSVGALCQLEMDYNLRQMGTLRQANGWCYGVINEKTGAYVNWCAKDTGGNHYVTAKDFTEI